MHPLILWLLFDGISSHIISEIDSDQWIPKVTILWLCLITYFLWYVGCWLGLSHPLPHTEKAPTWDPVTPVQSWAVTGDVQTQHKCSFPLSSNFVCIWLQIFRLAQFIPNSLVLGQQGNDQHASASCSLYLLSLCSMFMAYLFHLPIMFNTGFPLFTLDKAQGAGLDLYYFLWLHVHLLH